jgi:hypothetical protein
VHARNLCLWRRPKPRLLVFGRPDKTHACGWNSPGRLWKGDRWAATVLLA